MTDRKIEQRDGRCFGLQQLLATGNSIEIFIFTSKKKRRLVTARKLLSMKTLLTLDLSQHHKSGSMFFSREPVDASSNCSRLGNALCLCSPVQPAQAEQESCPKSLEVGFAL